MQNFKTSKRPSITRAVSKLSTFLFLLFFVNSASAQSNAKSQIKDKVVYDGYTIGIMPAEEGQGYGYTIYKGDLVFVVQKMNPFTFNKTGLAKKADAYKIAKWQINQLKPGERWPTTLPRPLPEKVARELSIKLNNSN